MQKIMIYIILKIIVIIQNDFVYGTNYLIHIHLFNIKKNTDYRLHFLFYFTTISTISTFYNLVEEVFKTE
jgi:hypothetical protein